MVYVTVNLYWLIWLVTPSNLDLTKPKWGNSVILIMDKSTDNQVRCELSDHLCSETENFIGRVRHKSNQISVSRIERKKGCNRFLWLHTNYHKNVKVLVGRVYT